jgi:predicted dehydrogenase
LLESADGIVAQFHTSWTQWKNRFSFEIFCQNGFARIEGLGGSYGPESLQVGRRKPEGGAPEIQTIDISCGRYSWQAEWEEFCSAVENHRKPLASIQESIQVMEMIDALYRSHRRTWL